MSEYSSFEGRVANLQASASDVYNFASDIRNFERFIPEGSISNFNVQETDCSFNVQSIGTVRVELIERNPYDKIVFKALLFGSNEFLITMLIDGRGDSNSSARVGVKSILNPVMKMMVSDTIKKFLDLLIEEMERFTDWK